MREPTVLSQVLFIIVPLLVRLAPRVPDLTCLPLSRGGGLPPARHLIGVTGFGVTGPTGPNEGDLTAAYCSVP